MYCLLAFMVVAFTHVHITDGSCVNGNVSCVDVNELKAETKLLRCQLDEAKAEIKLTTNQNQLMNKQIKTMKKDMNKLKRLLIEEDETLENATEVIDSKSRYCKSHFKTNPCGECVCLDDSQVAKKYTCDCQGLPPKRDCQAFHNEGHHVSGLYLITMTTKNATQVYCDQLTDNGGWTVIQRRFNGKTNFYRNWNAYKSGFGDLRHEFWLGLENIYKLTWEGAYPKGSILRIDIGDWSGKKIHAKYNGFKLDSAGDSYKLHIGAYSGTAGDSLSGHNGMKFTTYDRDNDRHRGNCAREYHGAWWYSACHASNLNGKYYGYGEKVKFATGVIWNAHKGYHYSQKDVDIKVKRIP